MTKAEFLETLEQKLTGEVPAETIRRNLYYYDNYIESAIRDGRTEREVLEELGSPLLIARTIIDTRQDENPYERVYETQEESGREEPHSFHLELNDKRSKWILIGILILILLAVFTVLRILMPILLPVLLIVFVVNLIKKR